MQIPRKLKFRRSIAAVATAFLIGSAPASGAPLDPNSYASLGTLAPSTAVTFNTDTLAVTGGFTGTGVIQAQPAGLPSIAVFTFSSILLPPGVPVNVVGNRPIALLSQGNATLHALSVDATGSAGRAGGGTGGDFNSPGSGNGGGGVSGTPFSGATGAGHGGLGGNPTTSGVVGAFPVGGPSAAPRVGGSVYGNLMTALQGGSGGGGSGIGAGGAGTLGGGGGGGIEIGAIGTLTLTAGIDARGGAGASSSSQFTSGGAGGGSGGAVLLHGATVIGAVTINVSGGIGGSGAGASSVGSFVSGSGGGGAGGRVVTLPGTYVVGSALPTPVVTGGAGGFVAGLGAGGGANGIAELLPTLTMVPSGLVRQLASNGTFQETVAGYNTFTTLDVGASTGGLLFATTAVTSSRNLRLEGGLASAGLGWTANGAAQVSGFGQLAGAFSGGATNSIAASGGVLTLGDANSTAGFSFAGATSVGGGATLQLQDANNAVLGSTTALAAGGRLASLNGILLGSGGAVSASGNATIDGAFRNEGTVNGPGTPGQFLTFAGDVTGPGGYTGNIAFSDGFSPGASPGIVTFANVVLDGTSVLNMELAGVVPGSGHDKLVVTGLLTLGGGTLNVVYLSGFTAGAGNTFDLFDWGTLSGTFGSILLPTLASGLSWNTSLLYVDGSISVTAAVPEPSTYAMLLAGLALLVFVQRRSRAIG